MPIELSNIASFIVFYALQISSWHDLALKKMISLNVMVREELMKRLFNTLEMLTKILSQMHIRTSPVSKCEIWLFKFSIISSILVSFFFFLKTSSILVTNVILWGKEEGKDIHTLTGIRENKWKTQTFNWRRAKIQEPIWKSAVGKFQWTVKRWVLSLSNFSLSQFLCLQISQS